MGRDMTWHAYTDGGYSAKREMGAWCYVAFPFVTDVNAYEQLKGLENIFLENSNSPLVGFNRIKGHSTSNRAELTAILKALEETPKDDNLVIWTDSQSSIASIKSKRNIEDLKNNDLIQAIRMQIIFRECELEFKKIKGHSGCLFNEIADSISSALMAY